MKFCKDCKHLQRVNGERDEMWRCNSPNNYTKINLVTGEKLANFIYCKSHRELKLQPSYVSCGEEGHWYEMRRGIS